MSEMVIIICWICAIANVIITILNVRITYKRKKAFVEYIEWIESEKMKIIEGLKKEK